MTAHASWIPDRSTSISPTATGPAPGPVLLTGVQAIARMLVEQHAADAAAGLTHGVVRLRVPGQPARRARPDPRPRRRAAGERRAHAGARRSTRSWPRPRSGAASWRCPATSASSTAPSASGTARRPGVDRAGDPMRHGNMCGAHPRGGVLVLAGDDPSCKSSTIPCISERTLAGYGLPVLFPGDRRGDRPARPLRRRAVPRVRHVGRHEDHRRRRRRACSTVDGDVAERRRSRSPSWSGRAAAGSYRQYPDARAARARCAAEAQLYGPRWAMVQRVPGRQPDQHRRGRRARRAGSGIVAGGKAFTDVRQALRRPRPRRRRRCAAAGIRLLRLGMIHPIERGPAARVRARPGHGAGGRGEVRRSSRRRCATCSTASPTRPPSIGSADADGRPLVPVAGELTAGRLTGPLRRVLGRPWSSSRPSAGSPPALQLLPVAAHPVLLLRLPAQPLHGRARGRRRGRRHRLPRHGRVHRPRPESEVTLDHADGRRGRAVDRAGARSPSAGHMFQNMGDGTFAHSGQLAMQACVAAGVVDHLQAALQPRRRDDRRAGRRGRRSRCPQLAAKLLAEGVARIIVVRRRAGALPRPRPAAARRRPVAPRPARRGPARARRRRRASRC